MSIIIKAVSKRQSFGPVIPEGPHSARLIGVYELGSQPNYEPDKPPVKKLELLFEFPEVRKSWKEGEPERPVTKSVDVTHASGETSNVHKILSALNGKNLDEEEDNNPRNFLGMALTIDIEHKISKKSGNPYAKFASYSKIPRKPGTNDYRYDVPEAENSFVIYDIDVHPENWDQLKEWTQDKIKSSPEYKKQVGQPVVHAEVEEHDDVSF